MYAVRSLLVAFLLCLLLCFASYAGLVPTSSNAAEDGPGLLEPSEFETPDFAVPMEVYALDDSVAALSVTPADFVNCVCFDVTISGTEYTLLFPSAYEASLMVDSDGYLWNVSGSSITGRLFSGSFNPRADTGLLLTLAPCLGNNFSANHHYGSPNYMRSYYWSSSGRLSYTDTYVSVIVKDTFHLFQTDDLLTYVVIFLIACCLICLFKRSGR